MQIYTENIMFKFYCLLRGTRTGGVTEELDRFISILLDNFRSDRAYKVFECFKLDYNTRHKNNE